MEASLGNALHCWSTSCDFGKENKDRTGFERSIDVLGWKGTQFGARQQKSSYHQNLKLHAMPSSIHAQSSIICIPKYMRWWEKSTASNMTEIQSSEQLVHSLLNAGDKLVIVDFYSPGCGGCKALHPKVCQIAEANPDAMFLKVNYELHKGLCRSLNIHVLPFFQFYRGAEGRVCSFSCTNATIKKFKIAMAKHGAERCGLGPARGLEELELQSLASEKDAKFTNRPGYLRTMKLAGSVAGGRD